MGAAARALEAAPRGAVQALEVALRIVAYEAALRCALQALDVALKGAVQALEVPLSGAVQALIMALVMALEAALRDIGARRYHNLHPFHRLLHDGKLDKDQVRAWALNRYYYQAMIPVKDATLLALGAYTHSRVREFLLGGVTRQVIESARMPVLMAH